MATPAFIGAGTAVFTANNVATPTALAPTKHASTLVGHLMLLVTESRNNAAPCTTPTGWVLLTGFPVSSGTASGGRIYVFSRIFNATANDDPSASWSSLTTGTSGDSCGARILTYSGASQTQAGTVPAATDTAATTNWTMPAITTTGNNSVAVGVSVKVSDTSQTTTITTFTERTDDNTQTGTGHVTEVSDKVQNAGSTGTGTVTPSSTTSSRVLAVPFAMAQAPDINPQQSVHHMPNSGLRRQSPRSRGSF